MDFELSPRAAELLPRVRAFIAEGIAPVEEEIVRDTRGGADWRQWRESPTVEELKARARDEGLWNLFLLPPLDYAPLAEAMGHSLLAPEIFNCNAPDSGNMELLHHYGTDAQKEEWLTPLLRGEIRSVFCMTEPDVASSDATNIHATIVDEGDTLLLNGRKWWTTGLGHPRAKLAIFMGRSGAAAGERHRQHSMVLVPLDTPGVTVERMLPLFGEYDAPYGHGEVTFTDVRVPRANLIGEPGSGFALAQGRLGPGRIHHCMRCIGASERALRLMIERGRSRIAFGKPLVQLGGNAERIARHRIAIDQARLLTLYAAWRLGREGVQAAMTEISAIKVVAPNVLQAVVDDAIQLFGGAGVSHDTPLTSLFSIARALRIADGPDEVHLGLIARRELARWTT